MNVLDVFEVMNLLFVLVEKVLILLRFHSLNEIAHWLELFLCQLYFSDDKPTIELFLIAHYFHSVLLQFVWSLESKHLMALACLLSFLSTFV